MAKFIFDKKRPSKSKEGTMKLQRFLLRQAEARYGNRDSNKNISQPFYEDKNKKFGGRAPFILNSLDGTSASAILSENAANYWPTALYELAHETIHLLNPIKGYTNYLEEGVAVAFSLEAMKEYTNHQPLPEPTPHYRRALELVKMLPNDFNSAIYAIREKCGSLGAATHEDLILLFPTLDPKIAKELSTTCDFT
jgi:hypothetical protein